MAAIDYVTAMGAGSGINTTEVVDALVEAQRAPLQQSIDRLQSKAEVQISAYGYVKSALTTLKEAFDALNDVSEVYDFAVSSSDSTVISGVADTDAIAGDYDVVVSTLATRSVWNSSVLSVADSSTSTGSGAFSITVGSSTVSVTTDTPDGIVDAINSASLGLTAGLIDTGNGFVVTIASGYGASNEVSMSSSTLTLTQQSVAVDAALTVNGVSVAASSNTVVDAVPGVTLTLSTTGSETITVSEETDTLETALRNLVAVYNSVDEIFDQLTTGADEEDAAVGSLATDSTFRSLKNSIRTILTTASSTASGNISYLSDMGIEFQLDGSLVIKETRFEAALTGEYEDIVQALTAGTDNQTVFGTANRGIAGDVSALLYDMLKSTGTISTVISDTTSDLSDYESKLLDLDARMERVRERYITQFSAMQSLVDQMNSTRDYLKQQLDNLPFTSKD